MLWLAWLLLASSPSAADAEPWLGCYTAGPETIMFRWDDGDESLLYHHGNITIPVDAAWHVTVPEFYVRHRVTWLDDAAVRLEESHDDSQPSQHELRLDDDRIVKVSLTGGRDGEEVVVRTYEKAKEGAPCAQH